MHHLIQYADDGSEGPAAGGAAGSDGGYQGAPGPPPPTPLPALRALHATAQEPGSYPLDMAAAFPGLLRAIFGDASPLGPVVLPPLRALLACASLEQARLVAGEWGACVCGAPGGALLAGLPVYGFHMTDLGWGEEEGEGASIVVTEIVGAAALSRAGSLLRGHVPFGTPKRLVAAEDAAAPLAPGAGPHCSGAAGGGAAAGAGEGAAPSAGPRLPQLCLLDEARFGLL